MRRLLALAVIAIPMALIGSAAMAQSLDGGCTVSATSDLDTTTMLDATQADPFDIDPEGTIAWNARSPEAIMDHNWVINVDIGGFGVPVAKGGDPNTAGTLDSVDERSIPELIERAKAAGVPNADMLAELRGIYRVFGDITGTSSCSGDAYVNIVGNPLEALVGQIAAGIAALGLILVIWSGVAKKP